MLALLWRPLGIALGLPCGSVASTMRSPSSGSALSSPSPSCRGVSTSCLALSSAQGTNTSGLAVTAYLALPVGSMLVGPLARAGTTPATGNAPPYLCMSMSAHLTSSMSAFLIMQANPKGSESLRRIGESSDANAPPDSYRSSACMSGCFQHLGQRSLAVHC